MVFASDKNFGLVGLRQKNLEGTKQNSARKGGGGCASSPVIPIIPRTWFRGLCIADSVVLRADLSSVLAEPFVHNISKVVFVCRKYVSFCYVPSYCLLEGARGSVVDATNRKVVGSISDEVSF
jgi:hypothetical protein